MGGKSMLGKGIQVKRKAKLLVPQKHISPGSNELYLRCGHCETFEFRLFVVAVEKKAAISAIACVKCGAVRKIDLNGFIEGIGELTDATETEHQKARMLI